MGASVCWPSGFRQTGFLSQLLINLGQIFPEPLVTFAAQQGVLPVVLPASLYVEFLLRSQSFFHPRFLSFITKSTALDFCIAEDAVLVDADQTDDTLFAEFRERSQAEM
jgi:hypothetical protein